MRAPRECLVDALLGQLRLSERLEFVVRLLGGSFAVGGISAGASENVIALDRHLEELWDDIEEACRQAKTYEMNPGPDDPDWVRPLRQILDRVDYWRWTVDGMARRCAQGADLPTAVALLSPLLLLTQESVAWKFTLESVAAEVGNGR